jgi:hypothetical protein
MRFDDALMQIIATPTKYMAHPDMVERHCYVKVQGRYKPLRLFNYKTGLEQDWVPTQRDLLSPNWQVLVWHSLED